MKTQLPKLGLGIGWRPELALFIDRRTDLGFVEVVAENVDWRNLPRPLEQLLDRGIRVIPHGISLSLGGAEMPDAKRVEHLAQGLAEKVDAPLVSEHIAFVRSRDVEIGHLTPIARTRESLEVLIENVAAVRKMLPVPLALENIAALFEWPDVEIGEGEFFSRAVIESDSFMLLDVSNAYANGRNTGRDALQMIRELPLERLAYVHMGGGSEEGGVYHDTHSDAVPEGAIELLEKLCGVCRPNGVMLERDDHFPGEAEMTGELDRIADAVARGVQHQVQHVR